MLSRAEAQRALVWNALSGRHARCGRPWGPEGGATGAYRLATGDSRARLNASFSFHCLLASVYIQLVLMMHHSCFTQYTSEDALSNHKQLTLN